VELHWRFEFIGDLNSLEIGIGNKLEIGIIDS